ncbi:hypothetical protein EON65_58965 [archaeon]|nr:MAG: hypothetical protein EON65_58965 [archaeon]
MLNLANMSQTPSIRYRSTRGLERNVTFEEAVLRGVPRDQGLFVPEEFPRITSQELKKVQ